MEAELADRRAEGLTIDPENCETIKYYADPRDIDGLFDLGDDICVGRELFVRNLPDGYWVWFGDLPEGTLKKLCELDRAPARARTSAVGPRRRGCAA